MKHIDTDPPPPRCDHNRPWGECDQCWAEIAAAVDRAATAIDTVQNMSEAEKAEARRQINATRLPFPRQK